MGGIVDCVGVDIDAKTSPRRMAIEKAQTELRQEYDAREERKRELEFLEKGGNPLEFKFSHGASISLQSTSFMDQQAEHCVISEAKGSFPLEASPHGDGDSVESSGRPVGGSAGREPNFADNLLLFEGENSNPHGDKNMKRTGKRGNAAMKEQSSVLDRCNNTKEMEDSLASRHGVKSQAYARRNRSRPSNSSKSLAPSSFPGSKNERGLLQEARAEDNAISFLSNLKPVSPNFASDNHLDMELDGEKNHDANSDMVKVKVHEREIEVGILENACDTNHCNQHIDAKSKQVANCSNSRSPDVIGNGEASSVGFLLSPQEPTESLKDIRISERNSGLGIPDKVVTDVHTRDPIRKTSAVGGVSQVLSLGNVKTDTDCTDKIKDGITVSNTFAIVKTVDSSSNGDPKELTVLPGATDNNKVRKTSQLISVNEHFIGVDESRSSHSSLNISAVQVKDEVERCDNIAEVLNEIRPLHKTESVKPNGESVSKPERKPGNSIDDSSHSINKAGVITSTLVLPTCEPSITLCKRVATATSAVQNCAASNLKLSKKLREDAILKEAGTIEVNLKRAGELSTCYTSLERRTKCHWDFVLKEMAWMSNDFMQEHLWKKAVAAHVCHQIASNSRTKYEQEMICQKQQSIARTLAISVVNFWHSADLSQNAMGASSGVNGDCTSDLFISCKTIGTEAERKEGGQYVKSENHHVGPAIQAYAIRFLKYDKDTFKLPIMAEAPTTPDRIHDMGVLEMSWEDQLSEESLFYTVPPGAMQAYREDVESQWANHKKMGNSVHPENCDRSVCDSVPDGPRDYTYEEEEGETGPYFLPGAIEGSLSSKLTRNKRKHLHQNSYAARLYDAGSDFSCDPCLGTSANQAQGFLGKRPSSSLNVGSIPTKRVRTAARPRVVSPFGAGVTGSLQVTSKTDVSSGDTNSLQDDQSSMHGGSQSRTNMEVESTMDFEKHVPSDSIEISTKYKKKKKTKHGYTMNLTDSCVLVVSGKGSLLDQRLQVDSVVQQEQRNYVKKSQHFEPNGNIGIYGQHVAKKPKLLKQLSEPSPDASMPGTGSLPSPAASQMSNMSNQSKLIKIIANRDRGRKSKAMKIAVGQSGSGIPWTNFEDQALVVLVHDMGPNWELVSDAINSTLQFKCIFRKPKDCKERHRYLMDKSAGDGADSAEDSGSSQPYPSTLPGIPKGSARQLFQHLQGPIVEDVLRTHFEKIILIRQQLHSRKSQNDKQELKQIIPVHSSHVVLSQACPNNLAGGVLTPLDLCDATASSSDALALGYQGSHTSGAAIPTHQGSVSPVISSGVNNFMQGSPGIVLSSNLPSLSTPINGPSRDSQRYCMPRTTSLPPDDQQRMHYNQMLSGRNIQQSSMSAPGALPMVVDRGVHMLPGANGVGMMGGRNMPLTRPGFQGMSAPGMLNMVSTGSMLAGSGVGMPKPNSVNVHPSSVSTPANSMMRPREALQILRPTQNTEDHRQMLMQDLQMQVPQTNAQAVPPFNGISAPFATATGLPSVQPYPSQQQRQQLHHMPQQQHMLGNHHHPHIQVPTNQSSVQQQAYAIRLAKERQHQRMMSQPQQPYSGSSTMSSMQNNSQLQQQIQPSSSVTPASSSQVQHNKQQIPRNPQSSSGMSNQMMKQRPRPQVPQQQQPRHQQKQLMHQQPKHIKGLGRGSMVGHPNLPVDPSQVNGLSVATRNPVSEKPVMQQGQGFFSPTSGLNPTLTQSSNHNIIFTRPPSQSSKQIPQLTSNSDTCNQGPLQVSTSNTLSAPQPPPFPTSLPLANVPVQQQQHRQMNPNMQRLSLTQNRPLSSDGKIRASADQVNQLVSASLPRCADPTGSASVTSSTTQWNPEAPCDTSTQAPPSHLAGSPQEGLVGTDSSVPPSSEEIAQMQFSGSVLPHGHGVRGQWVHQHQTQEQQQTQQSQHGQTSQGNSYALPSNSGPGG